MKPLVHSQYKKSQRGYSLIELSIVLAIIAVIIAGAVFGVQAILRANNVNKTISQTNTASNRIVAKLIRDINYLNATTANLSAANMEVWDAASINAVGDVKHYLGNNVFVAPLGLDTESGVDRNQGFVYTLTGVPVAACADLAAGVEGLALSMGIYNQAPVAAAPTDAINNDTAAAPVASTIKRPGLNYDSVRANTACTGAGNNVTNTATIRLLVPRR